MLGDRWNNLSRTAAVPYDRDALASVVARVVPFCGVEHLATEGIQPREMNLPWGGKPAHGSQEDGALSHQSLFRRRVNELNFPQLLLGQPSRADTSKIESKMRSQ